MIFLSVGTQLGFDRLIRTVDQWVEASPDAPRDIFAQIGPGVYEPRNMGWSRFVGADECRQRVQDADLIIAHAGMGSILTALELGKPIVVMPRRFELGEHRNDHQMATARHLSAQGRVRVAFSESELISILDEHARSAGSLIAPRIAATASPKLIEAIRQFVATGSITFVTRETLVVPELAGAAPSFEPALALASSKTAWSAQTSAGSASQTHSVTSGKVTAGAHTTTSDLSRSGDGSATFTGPARINPLTRLRALILLGGSVRQSTLSEAVQRSVLDLPLGPDFGIMDLWRTQARRLAQMAGCERLPVRVVSDARSPGPSATRDNADDGLNLRIEQDPRDYRGTGGVLADIAKSYEDDDWILVGSAAQVLMEPLDALATELARAALGNDVEPTAAITFFRNEDESACSLFLINRRCLRMIPDVGFIDLKEQAMPRIASRFVVRTVTRRLPVGLPVRTFEDYTRALQLDYDALSAGREPNEAFAERWRPKRSLIETGAKVDPTAKLHDSVVLDGGIVESGAVLVRSVICRGGVVPRGKVVVDELVS